MSPVTGTPIDVTTEAVTLTEVKAQARIDDSESDTLLGTYMTAARVSVENYLRRTLLTTTRTWTFDKFPSSVTDALELPWPPLQSITSITYYDTDGDEQTWSADEYAVDITTIKGRVRPAYGETWPATRVMMGAVTITYVAGYGDDRDDVPEPIRRAILWRIASWYENREEIMAVPGIKPDVMPAAFNAILDPYRVRTYT